MAWLHEVTLLGGSTSVESWRGRSVVKQRVGEFASKRTSLPRTKVALRRMESTVVESQRGETARERGFEDVVEESKDRLVC